MRKLHLKRTPTEQAAHDLKKSHKAARKAAKKRTKCMFNEDESEDRSSSYSQKRRRTECHDADDSDTPYGPSPPPETSSHRAHKPDYDYIQAQVEEERFREKLWGALGDDERLDSVEARLNDFAHVPRRWRSGGMDNMEDDFTIDPHMMEDEVYAEWVRAGMWRKKHSAEHAEQRRKQQESAARLAREEEIRAETKRMEKEAVADQRRKRKEKHQRRWTVARESYDTRWRDLLNGADSEGPMKMLGFMDIPWPVFLPDAGPVVHKKGSAVDEDIDIDAITSEAISAFLLPPERFGGGCDTVHDGALKKERREKLREAMLRFHPDKFEGRILGRVEERDREKTKAAVAKVAVALNTLMATVE